MGTGGGCNLSARGEGHARSASLGFLLLGRGEMRVVGPKTSQPRTSGGCSQPCLAADSQQVPCPCGEEGGWWWWW